MNNPLRHLASISSLTLGFAAFATSPAPYQPCQKAARMAASAMERMNSSAWEMDKYGVPASLDISLFETENSTTLVSRKASEEGEVLTYNMKSYNFHDTLLSNVDVTVRATKTNANGEKREFCSIESIVDKSL